ncbi:MAG: exopolysaccharide biosynthesis polyprenyl glycosylphosphotransferase [Cyclobacteriaceae bacterium]|nr:exopolysaccharide biosynthesis polyprenyl glycosylphosphotransferase [Cyclobacteriaceae bacterium]
MSRILRFLLYCIDFVNLNLSIILAIHLASAEILTNVDSKAVYLFGFSNLSMAFLFLVSNPSEVSKGLGLSKILRNQLAFIFIHLLLTVSLVYFFNQRYHWSLITLIYTLFFAFYFVSRITVFYLRKVFAQDLLFKNYVIIGRNSLANEIRRYYLLHSEERYRFIGYIDYEADTSVLDLIQYRNEQIEIHEIFCCVSDMANEEFQSLIKFGLNSLIKVKLVIEPGVTNNKLLWNKSDVMPGINIPVIALDDPFNRFLKRTFDIVFSLIICLLVMTWLTPLIALLIKIDSPGSIFFKQLRNGEGNKAFSCFKFRTMQVNSDSDLVQATKDDHRITKLGFFLRKSSIDELPQFFNVLRGDMSVVGPRPHMLKHTEEYRKLIELFMIRQYIKPGITGLAQCLGYRGETNLRDMENRVRLDRYYVENWSFWIDIKIVFLTVVSLLRGSDKAY